MQSLLTKTEAMLLVAFIALVAAALGGPPLAQSPHYHDFASRGWGDVLSNIPFALAGATGLWLLWTAPRRSFTNMHRAMAFLFFGGLLLVALGSAAYHLAPTESSRAADRYCMAVAMAGLLGLAAASRVGEGAAAALGMAALYAGLASVKLWTATGNLLPWGVFQFGAMLLLVWLGTLPALLRALPVKWWLVIAAYAAAKVFELGDYPVYELTGHVVSGHTLKHLCSALATVPVLLALGHVREARQNAVELQDGGELDIRWVKV